MYRSPARAAVIALVVAVLLAPMAFKQASAGSASSVLDQGADEAAAQDVVRRANLAEAQGTATGDFSPLRELVTSEVYDGMTQLFESQRAMGVVGAQLDAIEFVETLVMGNDALIETLESWTLFGPGGEALEGQTGNLYSLIKVDGRWVIDGFITEPR